MHHGNPTPPPPLLAMVNNAASRLHLEPIAMHSDDHVLDLSVDKNLFTRDVNESVVLHEGSPRRVEASAGRQRTAALHDAVSSGNLDLVVELLGMGADPSHRDNDNGTAVEVAEGMSGIYPQDYKRREILKLVKAAYEWNCICNGTPAGSGMAAIQTDSGKKIASSLPRDPTPNEGVTSQQVLSVKAAIDDISNGLEMDQWNSKSDLLFNRIQAAVMPFMERWCHDLKESVTEKMNVLIKEVVTSKKSDSERIQDFSLHSQVTAGLDCIEAMMAKTIVPDMNEDKVHRVRHLYKVLYSTSALTSCLMTFIKYQSQVQIVIDCDSLCIERIESRIFDHDGNPMYANNVRALVDFCELKVYLGGMINNSQNEVAVVGALAMSLAQLSIYLAFRNGGRPYRDDDKLNEERFKRIVVEAEKKLRNYLEQLDWLIYNALTYDTQLGKEISLISTVPSIIAYYGSRVGARIMHDQVPSLINYYKDHVMATLLDKLRV